MSVKLLLERTNILRLAFLALIAAAAAGCGGSTVTLTGAVTIDGEPLTTGIVTFHPVDEGPLAIAQIGPDGRYSLNGTGRKRISTGEYLVTVTAVELLEETDSGAGGEAIPKLLTPAKYGDKGTSGLRHTVTPGENRFDISLKHP